MSQERMLKQASPRSLIYLFRSKTAAVIFGFIELTVNWSYLNIGRMLVASFDIRLVLQEVYYLFSEMGIG